MSITHFNFTVKKTAGLFIAILVSLDSLMAQQVPDTNFDPQIYAPVYSPDQGPIVLLDEAHNNFHTVEGRYYVFAKILRKDGYIVQSGRTTITPEVLKNISILTIANALNIENVNTQNNETRWVLPTPSAFSDEEIQAIEAWVKNGGSLLLIADHMPFPGAAFNLAHSFGYTLYNGFASEIVSKRLPGQKRELDVFTKETNTLAEHPITSGRNEKEQIERVATFTGQAFQIPEKATSLLTFDDRYEVLLPDTAWSFSPNTERITANGLSQGAISEYGKGRVAVFGEAAMFSGQLKGVDKKPMGLNDPEAKENIQFLLNLIHWLDRKL